MTWRGLGAGVMVVSLLGVMPWTASVGSRDASVPLLAEAWYHVSAAAAPPGTPPVNPFPADTLQVQGGVDEQRTYLALDLSSLPLDAEVTGGTLRLPLDNANSVRADAAKIKVCLGPLAPSEVYGGVTAAPPFDCSVAVNAVYAADPAPALIVDLQVFGRRLGQSGLALLADPTDPAPVWHVALLGRLNATDHPKAVLRTTLQGAPVAEVPSVAPTDPLPPFEDGVSAGDTVPSIGA
nr:hypothetical protein [Actinomycetota bacterium]